MSQFIMLSEQRHTCVNTCPGLLRGAEWPGLEPATLGCKSEVLTTTSPHATLTSILTAII